MHLELQVQFGCSSGNPIFADNLFADLPPKSLDSLARIKRTTYFPKSIIVIAKDRLPSCVYVLKTGQAQMLSSDQSCDRRFNRLVELNEFLGLTEVITNLPYKMNVETVTPCCCEFIVRQDLIRFLRDEQDVCFRLAQLLGLNLRKAISSFVDH